MKAGLLLGLFGGVSKHHGDGDVLVRGEPHILLVGDPGQGKNQLLQAVSALAPRSVFVCGSSATVSELTVTLTKVCYMHSGISLIKTRLKCTLFKPFNISDTGNKNFG